MRALRWAFGYGLGGMGLGIIILAAGQSRRMRGGDKLLEMVNGQPLLRHIQQAAAAAACPVWVALPGPGHPRAAHLLPTSLPVYVPDAALGMGASIRHAVAALPPDISAAMITPADMPELTGADFIALAGAYRGQILRATSAHGQAGHPVIFPRSCFADLLTLQGDQGARALLAQAQDLQTLALPGTHATTDLDTPEAWAEWRAAQHP